MGEEAGMENKRWGIDETRGRGSLISSSPSTFLSVLIFPVLFLLPQGFFFMFH
jgi:hypothetical protein